MVIFLFILFERRRPNPVALCYSSATLSTRTLALLAFFPNFNKLSRLLTLPTLPPIAIAGSDLWPVLPLRLIVPCWAPCFSGVPSNPESVTQSPSAPSPLSDPTRPGPLKKLRLFSLPWLSVLLVSSLRGWPFVMVGTGACSCLFRCRKLRRLRSWRAGRDGVSRIEVSVVCIVPLVCELGIDLSIDESAIGDEIRHPGMGVRARVWGAAKAAISGANVVSKSGLG